MAKKRNISESTMTSMQETASAWVFKRAIQDNVSFNSANDIKKDKKTFDQILDIWKKIGRVEWDDNIDMEWLETFYKQQDTLLKKIGSPNFTEFCRSSGYTLPGSRTGETFMEWVTKLVNSEFSINQKDNWNPADIWLIQNEEKWKTKIKEAIDTPRTSSLTPEQRLLHFNAIFRALFRTKQIMGISLKKIGKGPARWKEVNVSGKFFKQIETVEMSLISIKCSLGTKLINAEKAKENIERGKFRGKPNAATLLQDTVITVKDPSGFGNDTNKAETYEIQVKANDSGKKQGSNLKWEPQLKGGSSRLGKATVDSVLNLMSQFNIRQYYEADHSKYPSNRTKFRKEENAYRNMIDEIISEGSVDCGGVDAANAVVNIAETYDLYRSQPWIAKSKLQQLQFIYAFLQLTPSDRNKFVTSLIFLAEKAGRKYGPYGKLY